MHLNFQKVCNFLLQFRDIIISDLTPQLINIFTVPNVKEIILYGSVARGTATSESDIDIAVILDDYTDKMHDEMIEFVVDLELKYNKVISVLPIYNKQFNEWGNITPFFKNIKKDGKVLWKAAF